MRYLALILTVIVAAALIINLTGSDSPARIAPPLPRTALVGQPTSLGTLRGAPALIAFFASWCGPCEREAPVLATAARRLRGRARLVAIDWTDNRHDGLVFVKRYRWSFAVLSDPQGTVGYAYRIAGLPTSFVLDARGRIVSRLIGPQTLTALLRAVREAARE